MSGNPYETGPFRHASDMENPLATVADILHGMALIAETMDDDYGRVVQRMAWLAIEQCNAAERLRGELFHLTHPRREHFEKEGWPS
jgi:hypothetical protein